MFRAVEIEGETYWDGGYAGNPTITPLIREGDARDTILVQINSRERHPGCRRFLGEYGLWRTNQALQLTNGSSCWKV
jgi:predicted acylesterase/phospholipase RssA